MANIVNLHENDELALERIGLEQGKHRIEFLGAHKVHTTKVKPPKWGVSSSVKVERVKKRKANINSIAWKKYLNKEITFAELMKSGQVW